MPRDVVSLGPLEDLASRLDATSPGFAARIRDVAPLLSELPSDVAAAFTSVLSRLVALEGPGREATQGLITRSARELESIGASTLEEWCAAVERIAARSLRAASTFAAAVLPALSHAPTARGEPLARAARRRRPGKRHGADLILQRFAARRRDAGEPQGRRALRGDALADADRPTSAIAAPEDLATKTSRRPCDRRARRRARSHPRGGPSRGASRRRSRRGSRRGRSSGRARAVTGSVPDALEVMPVPSAASRRRNGCSSRARRRIAAKLAPAVPPISAAFPGWARLRVRRRSARRNRREGALLRDEPRCRASLLRAGVAERGLLSRESRHGRLVRGDREHASGLSPSGGAAGTLARRPGRLRPLPRDPSGRGDAPGEPASGALPDVGGELLPGEAPGDARIALERARDPRLRSRALARQRGQRRSRRVLPALPLAGCGGGAARPSRGRPAHAGRRRAVPRSRRRRREAPPPRVPG